MKINKGLFLLVADLSFFAGIQSKQDFLNLVIVQRNLRFLQERAMHVVRQLPLFNIFGTYIYKLIYKAP